MSRKRRGRGEGSVYQRADDGVWVGSVSLGYGANGKRRRRVVYGKTKQEVQAELRRLQGEVGAGKYADPVKTTLGEYLESWLEHTARGTVRPKTFQRYEQLVKLHIKPVLGGTSLAKLRAIDVQGCYITLKQRGASAWVRRDAGTLLSGALRYAVRLGMIPFNPAADVARARPEEKEMLFLTEEQLQRFLDAARGDRLFALYALAVGGGMRQGELLGLKWEDIDFDKGAVAVRRSLSFVGGQYLLKEPKTRRSRRTVTLPRFALDALRDHKAAMDEEGHRSPFVFVTTAGTFICNGNLFICNGNLLKRSFRPIVRAAGVPAIRFHDLRHTHATILLSRGHSLKAVSQRLGHEGPEVTLRVYAHVMPTDDDALAGELDRVIANGYS